jgi:hypothetical protein
VVGERVGELGRDRPDLAANAAEVVEQARPLLRELGEQRRKPEDVDARDSRSALARGSGLLPAAVRVTRSPFPREPPNTTPTTLSSLVASATSRAYGPPGASLRIRRLEAIVCKS